MHKMFKNTRLTILIAGLSVLSTHKVFCPQEEQGNTKSLEELEASYNQVLAKNVNLERQVRGLSADVNYAEQRIESLRLKAEEEKNKNQQLESWLQQSEMQRSQLWNQQRENEEFVGQLKGEISRFCEQGANQVDVVELANLIEANARLRMRNARLEQECKNLLQNTCPKRFGYLQEFSEDLENDQNFLMRQQREDNVNYKNLKLLQTRLKQKEKELAIREQGLAAKEELVNRITGSSQRLPLELPEADSTLTTLRKSRASIGDENEILSKYQSILAKEVAAQQAREALTPAARAALARQGKEDEDKRFEELLQESANRYQMYDKAISSVE